MLVVLDDDTWSFALRILCACLLHTNTIPSFSLAVCITFRCRTLQYPLGVAWGHTRASRYDRDIDIVCWTHWPQHVAAGALGDEKRVLAKLTRFPQPA